MGLLANATAIPVANSRVGAASAAMAIDIHGAWDVSVKTIPEMPPAFSRVRAREAAWFQFVGPIMKSNRISRSSVLERRVG
jgi:hypothetical protein